MEKPKPSVPELVKQFRERRQILHSQKTRQDEGQNLCSTSKKGKQIESKMCQKFTALNQNEKGYSHEQPSAEQVNEKINIETVTNRLIKNSDQIYRKWRDSRHDKQRLQKILNSLTADKRIQRLL